MNILLTGAGTDLGRALTAGLAADHQLRLTDRRPLESEREFVQSDLGHDESTDRLVAGVEAIVHQPGPGVREADGPAWIDACTRCTYNLLLAAAEADVKQVVLLSTLDLFLPYDEDMTVGETWRPRPSCEPRVMGLHLSEFVAKEFVHQRALDILVLRLGHVVEADDAGQPFDPMWVASADVVRAVRAALERDGARSQILHLQAESPRARFGIARIKQALDFSPQFNFEEIA